MKTRTARAGALARAGAAAPARGRIGTSHHTHRSAMRWLLAPAVIFLLVWMLVPLVITFYYSFENYNLMMPLDRGFVGMLNYRLLLDDPIFWAALGNTLVLVFFSLILTVGFGLALALLFNRTFALRGLARTLVVAPFFVMPVVAGLIWKNMLMHPVYGLFAWVFRSLGLGPVNASAPAALLRKISPG